MELNPQAIIDEMSKRIHTLTLENIVMSAQLAQIKTELDTPNAPIAAPEQ